MVVAMLLFLAVPITARLASFSYLVGDVVVIGSQEQVIEPHAARVVAFVQHVHFGRAVRLIPYETMSAM
jgi:hypothetical protein